MLAKNPLIDRLRKDELARGKKDFLHTSIYAKAQSGSGIGAASTESFEKRKKIEKNRETIRGYRDSLIAAQRPNIETLESRLRREIEEASEGGGSGSDEGDSSGSGVATEKYRKKKLGKNKNLYRAAEKRAERSARFTPKKEVTPAKPAAPPPRRLPGI